MAEKQEGKQVQLNEQQLIQMAQQEEASLMNSQTMIQRLNALLKETIISKEALSELEKTNGKVMINLGATVLVEAQIVNLKKCKRGISENAYKEEAIEETKKWLAEKEIKLQKQITKLTHEYTQTEQRLNGIVGILKQIEAQKRSLYEHANQKTPMISK